MLRFQSVNDSCLVLIPGWLFERWSVMQVSLQIIYLQYMPKFIYIGAVLTKFSLQRIYP